MQAGLVITTTPVATGIVYALARWVEPHLPPWLTRIVLGNATQPTYSPTVKWSYCA